MAKNNTHYRLLHIAGCTDPDLQENLYLTWNALEKGVVKLIQKGDYDEESDGLFFVEIGPEGKLADVCAFSGRTMDRLRERAVKSKA